MNYEPPQYSIAFAWGQDFWRAFHERPRVLRWFAFVCMGRYATRELIGMRDAIEAEGYSTHFPYEQEHLEYHYDKVNKWL